MSQPEPARQLYQRLVLMHEEAFAAGRFELGYHVLAAALHAAEELEDLELLNQLGRVAETRQQEIDAGYSAHRLSSTSARRRGNPAQYSTLAAIAAAARGRITAERALARSQRLRE
jgi:hypothetical protein